MPPPPTQPAQAFSLASLLDRASRMFLGVGERPCASGVGIAVSAATLELVLAVCVAAETVWKQHGAEIKRGEGRGARRGGGGEQGEGRLT